MPDAFSEPDPSNVPLLKNFTEPVGIPPLPVTAARTFSAVLAFSIPGALKNRDTVAVDTPAAAAMSSIVVAVFFLRFLFLGSGLRESLALFITPTF